MGCLISGNGVSHPISVYVGITAWLSWKGVSLRDCGDAPTSCLHKGDGEDGRTAQYGARGRIVQLTPQLPSK